MKTCILPRAFVNERCVGRFITEELVNRVIKLCDDVWQMDQSDYPEFEPEISEAFSILKEIAE